MRKSTIPKKSENERLLEYALSLARDLAHSWPRGPHQYYLCAIPLSDYDPYAFNPRTRYLIIYR
jgi:hypothetical protein